MDTVPFKWSKLKDPQCSYRIQADKQQQLSNADRKGLVTKSTYFV